MSGQIPKIQIQKYYRGLKGFAKSIIIILPTLTALQNMTTSSNLTPNYHMLNSLAKESRRNEIPDDLARPIGPEQEYYQLWKKKRIPKPG